MGDLVMTKRFGGAPVVQERWRSKQQLAEVLSVSTRTVDRWVLQGLPAGAWRYVGGRRRFLLSAVLAWLDVQ